MCTALNTLPGLTWVTWVRWVPRCLPGLPDPLGYIKTEVAKGRVIRFDAPIAPWFNSAQGWKVVS